MNHKLYINIYQSQKPENNIAWIKKKFLIGGHKAFNM